jgi:hypothetical protein
VALIVMIRRFFAQGPWVESHLAQWITTTVIMIHIGLGTAILAGGKIRFSLPSYSPLIDYSHGNVWVWGVWICVSALLMATPFRVLNILGLWIGMVWHTVWMACFTVATLRFDTAAATPIPIYGGMAMICAALLTARVIDRTEE